MASVMYVTDHGMIEYHRINGDDDLIFWRPLSQTRMKKFYPGDLIFFLTKVDVPGHSNEKGIVGYGRYVYSEKLRLDTMWKKYTTKNGFDTKAELTKVLKELSGEIPEKISCLYVNHLVFFAEPVFPSEVGMKIPGNLESYMYTNTGKMDYTYPLLKKGKEAGISYWATVVAQNSAETGWFEKDLRRYRVSSLQDKIGNLPVGKTADSDNRRVMHGIVRKDPEVQPISDRGTQYFRDDENGVTVYIPAMISPRDTDALKHLAGHISMWSRMTADCETAHHFVVVTKEKTAERLREEFALPNNVHLLSA